MENKVPEFKLKHIGINARNAKEAEQIAKQFCNLFQFTYKAGNSSDFADTVIEVMKEGGPGTNGHIAFTTESVDKAVEYLLAKGVSFREETKKYDSDGTLKVVYLADEIAGFAVHLLKS